MDTLNILSLLSGSGMLDSGVETCLRARGLHGRTICYVEREASAAAALVARMGTPGLGKALVWDDIETFDGRRWGDLVDIFIASPPCQPYSSAGSKVGNEDVRSFGEGEGPLFHLARIIGECRPAVAFFENVPEWVVGGYFRRFGEELSRMGYEIQAPLFLRSSDVGAPHERERVFVMAHAAWPGWRSRPQWRGMREAGNKLADTRGPGLQGDERGGALRAGGTLSHGTVAEQREELGNPEGAERENELEGPAQAGYGRTADDGRGIPRYPPGRDDFRAWGVIARLDPRG